MNELIAKVFVDTKVQAMSAISPMADWSAWMASTPLMTVVEEVTQREFEHARAALSALPTGWRETMQWSGIDGEAFPLQAEEYAGDNPSSTSRSTAPTRRRGPRRGGPR